MPIVLVGSSISGTSDSNGTSCTVPVPDGTEAGHIALLAIENWETYDASNYVWPPGFVQVVSATGGNRLKLFVACKRLQGPDVGDYVVSWSGTQWNMGHCLLVSGALSVGDPIDDVDTGAALGTTTLPPLAVVPVTAALLAHFVTNENSASGQPPAQFFEVRDGNYLKSNYRVLEQPEMVVTTGGSTSIVTSKVAALVAIKPEVVLEPPTVPADIVAGTVIPQSRVRAALVQAHERIGSGPSNAE